MDSNEANDHGKLPHVSIVIPAYNAAGTIQSLLKSLATQTYPEEQIEILLVDNGSTDDTVNRIRNSKHLFRTPPRILQERWAKNAYVARNRGIEAASGEIIAFTDADCIPEKTWLECGVATLIGCGRRAIIGGQIELFTRDSYPWSSATSAELYEKLFAFSREHFLFSKTAFQTANLMVWKSCFPEIGLFDPMLKSGGDFHWCWQAGDKGFELHYAENCIVRHPARRTLRELIAKSRRVAGSSKLSIARMRYSQIKKPQHEVACYSRALMGLFKNNQVPTVTKKVQILLIALILKFVKIVERIRIDSGLGSAKR